MRDAVKTILANQHLLPEYEKVFRELRSRQAHLTTEILAAQGQSERGADDMVDRAVALLSNLRQTCRRANPVQLREFLRQAVEKVVIDVEKTLPGRRHHYRLRGGDVHMQLYNLGLTARRTEQPVNFVVFCQDSV